MYKIKDKYYLEINRLLWNSMDTCFTFPLWKIVEIEFPTVTFPEIQRL